MTNQERNAAIQREIDALEKMSDQEYIKRSLFAANLHSLDTLKEMVEKGEMTEDKAKKELARLMTSYLLDQTSIHSMLAQAKQLKAARIEKMKAQLTPTTTIKINKDGVSAQ